MILHNEMSFRFTIVSALLLLALMAGCSRPPANSNSEIALPNVPAAEYTDANQALTDGIKLLDAGDTERAIEVLSRAVELNPDLAEAYFRLGIAYSLIEFRDQNEARESLEPTPEPSPGEKRPTDRKTNSEIAFEKAVAAYKKVIDANPEDHNAYYNMGRALNKLNEDEEAAKALRQAVKLNPDDTEYQTELGSILIKLAKYPEAVAALKKALELDSGNLEAEELLEKAEAGRRRIAFTEMPGNKNSNSNTNTSSNSASNTSSSTDSRPASDPKQPAPAASPDKPAASPTTRSKQP